MDRFRMGALVFALGAAAIVGVVSYNAGVAHGLAIGPALASAPATAAVPYWAYRPWGWGFGFGPLFFVLFFWLVMFRIFAWGGRRRGCYPRGPFDIPRDFDQWHRRAHEGMNKPL